VFPNKKYTVERVPGFDAYDIYLPCMFCGSTMRARVDSFSIEAQKHRKEPWLKVAFPFQCGICGQTNHLDDYIEYHGEPPNDDLKRRWLLDLVTSMW